MTFEICTYSSLISAANWPFHDRAVGLVYFSFTLTPK